MVFVQFTHTTKAYAWIRDSKLYLSDKGLGPSNYWFPSGFMNVSLPSTSTPKYLAILLLGICYSNIVIYFSGRRLCLIFVHVDRYFLLHPLCILVALLSSRAVAKPRKL